MPRVSTLLTEYAMDSYGHKAKGNPRQKQETSDLDGKTDSSNRRVHKVQVQMEVFKLYRRHRKGCNDLQMKVRRLQLELDGLQQKRKMAKGTKQL